MAKPRMSLLQTSLFTNEDILTGTIRELASNPKILEFIESVINNCAPAYPYLLFIPESRYKPFTKSQLYRKVKKFERAVI